MPRFARVHYPTGIYHLISRCSNRKFLIAGEAERQKYLQLLGNAASKCDAVILAYCIMSNHIHLVVRAGKDPFERLMKSVHSGFAVWLNNQSKGRRDGAVFSQRYRSILVEEEPYLFELIRYIHNNPVRARVAPVAADSGWSSHRAYIGKEPAPSWLNCGYVLTMFHPQSGWARRRFDSFVNEGAGEKRRPDLNGEESTAAARRFQSAFGDSWRLSGPVVGSDQFAVRVLEDVCRIDGQVVVGGAARVRKNRVRPTLDQLTGVVCAHVGLEPWEFEHQPKKLKPALARKLIVMLWVNEFGGKQCDVSRKFDVSSAAVSKWYSNAVKELPELDGQINEIAAAFPTSLESGGGQKTRFTFELEK